MSYFLPFQSRTRFAALNDIPAVETYLSEWLLQERSWQDLLDDTFLQTNLVDGERILGVFFKRDKTFVTNAVGNPQIKFENNPKSLLFVFGNYNVIESTSTFSYDKLSDSYIRQEISAHSYTPSVGNIESVLKEISRLDLEKLGQQDKIALQSLINSLNQNVAQLSKRNDPIDVIMPVIAAESAERRAIIQDILTQLNTLQPSTNSGIINLTNYPTKTEFYEKIWNKTDKGYVDGLISSKASQTDLNNHINDPAHKPTYLQVGSPSRSEFEIISGRVLNIENSISNLEGLNPVRGITTTGGLLATQKSNGVWNIDVGNSHISTMDKPQETTFFFGGPLLANLDTGGRWIAWESASIIGIRVSLNVSSQGSPVIIDIKNNGVSVYVDPLNRPRLNPGEKDVLALVPDLANIKQGDSISVDVVDVGNIASGEDLTVQMRYQYVN